MILIRLKDLEKVYQMGLEKVHALRGVDLELRMNEYVSIMGPSGSGKSTLMNIFGCLDVPTKGIYYFGEENVGEMNDNQLADIRNRQIGFVFQTFNLLPRVNLMSNVELPLVYGGVARNKRKKMAMEALERVGLEKRFSHKPNEISGGERQRVAIARAIVNSPSIILADEPTGNLDTKTGIGIMKVFSDLHAAGNTIIIVTHEEHIAAYSHRIIRIRDGEIEKDEQIN
ncbi:ABC transporter ATP-binding protein [candidate division KSB1 bacterium]